VLEIAGRSGRRQKTSSADVGRASNRNVTRRPRKPHPTRKLGESRSGTDPFWKQIKLNDRRTITTLGDTRELISTLPLTAQVVERWVDADEMLVRAQAAPSARDDALAAVVRALKAEGFEDLGRNGAWWIGFGLRAGGAL
jgi:hypothetical protein